jgi:hypothetical protein
MAVKTPTIFVSYAWEDDVRIWVQEFATRLRREGGVDVRIDQWGVVPGDSLPEFMEKSVRDSDFILIVCTPKYKVKSDARQGGVGYEGHIITGELFTSANHRKFIPVLRKGEWTAAAPSFLQGKLYLDLRGNPHDQTEYERLLKVLHGQWAVLPTIGPSPVFSGGTPVTGGASVASLPGNAHTPIPPPSAVVPTRNAAIKRSWLWLVLGAVLVGIVLFFALQVSRSPEPEKGVAAPTATDVCCGGVDCPKELQRTEGTSCERPDACRPCKSGRRRVAGACAESIPATNTYRLRLAGVTTPGYKPAATDTICVQLAGATPVCAMVSDANANPVLGLARMADLTADVDVWFDRGKTRMRSLRGMRVQRPMSQFMNSALCVGAVLYSADESEIVRFYLEDR